MTAREGQAQTLQRPTLAPGQAQGHVNGDRSNKPVPVLAWSPGAHFCLSWWVSCSRLVSLPLGPETSTSSVLLQEARGPMRGLGEDLAGAAWVSGLVLKLPQDLAVGHREGTGMEPLAGQCCPLETSFLSHTSGAYTSAPSHFAPSGLLLASGWGTNQTASPDPSSPLPEALVLPWQERTHWTC